MSASSPPGLLRLALAALIAASLAAQATQAARATPTPAAPAAEGSEPSTIAPAYWQQHREGWFWYRDPPQLAPPPRPKPPARPARPPELADFEAMQQRLEMLKRVAVMNPSDINLRAYMRYQRMVMDKSQVFADRWQRLVWQEPDLDYSLSGRPTHTLAVAAFDERQRDRDTQAVRQLASTHGLIFVFRGDCPFCHRFAPILKRFARQHGLTVLAVSLDGGTLPEYPDARPDNGIAARLNARAVPALYLTQPRQREVRTVGFGLMSDTELLERLATLAREADPATPPTASRNTP